MNGIIKNEDVKILQQGSIDLLVESYSSVAATLQIRGMAQEQAISADIVTTTDRAVQATIIDITGVPIFLTARTLQRGVKRGQLYIKVSLRVDGAVVALLMAGYVAEMHKVAYPDGDFEGSTDGPGLIRSITGTNPAAGVEISEIVPPGVKWKLLAVRTTLVTDATVINRSVILKITDGADTLSLVGGDTSMTASTTTVQFWSKLFGFGTTAYAGDLLCLLLINDLKPGYVIATVTTNLQPGDNWAAPKLLVEEWIEP